MGLPIHSSGRYSQMSKNRIEGLYLILDQQYTNRDIVSIAMEAVEAGVDVIQYREKVLSRKGALAIARRLREITDRVSVPFIINDDPAIALASDADGVHLGQEDIPVEVARRILGKDKIIGISTHSLEEVSEAGRLDVDYIGFGPIFHSATKMVTSPHGIDGIKRIRAHVSIPVIAIGGIAPENVSDVLHAGADGIAVISAILTSPDVRDTVLKFRERIR